MLFRRQALGKNLDRLHGDVIVAPKASSTYITLFLLAWMVLAVLFLTQTSFARSETVLGWLEPSAGLVKVFAHKGGKVARVLVGEGEAVTEGQPLAVINGDNMLADGRHLEDILLNEYATQQQVFGRSLSRIAEKTEHERQRIKANRQYAERQLTWIDAQLGTLSTRIELFKNRRVAQEKLNAKGLVSDVDLDFLREQELELQNSFQAVSASRVELLNQIDQLEASLVQLAQKEAEDYDALALKLSDLSQAIARLRGERAYVVTASIDGVISGIRAKVGQQSRTDRHLMTIVPESSPMLARLLVPTRSSGFVKPGQKLEFRYDAYPHQKFGLYGGTITEVSGSVSLTSDFADSPIPLQEPAYQVSAVLHEDAVLAYGERFDLRPGMTLSADITLEERSVLRWLLDPILSLRGRL